jgi:NAD(P)-dependent dehydrogenase (short-subunit alcohol dehydrogenase family)
MTPADNNSGDSTMISGKNAVYLVVGGSGGIGSAVAVQLTAQGGASVIISGRDSDRLAAAGAKTGAKTLQFDARDSAAVDAAIQEVHEEYGRLDGLVNCAGSILLKPAHLISDQEFADTLAMNLTSAFNVLRAGVRLMMHQSGGGSIVLCSSVAARRGLLNHEAIAAAKAGVEGLALAAAASYARHQVRVNCVAPGLTRTGLTSALTQNEAVSKTSAALHPLGRIGEPSEVASAICWLLDKSQSWVTGQVIGVDGGLGNLQARR